MASAKLTVLMVAEKPSIAEALAKALAGNAVTKRTGISPRSPVYEYSGTFRDEPANFKVTSTAGHIYSLDFPKEFNDWHQHGPEELFNAPVQHCYDAHAKLPEHLRAEASGCHVVVLWLDCDREGENICFEVIKIVLPVMDGSRFFLGAFRDRVFRAKFSSLVSADLQHAMAHLAVPNLNESLSVDARQEIDLRLGIAFSRFQTQYFRTHFQAQLGSVARTVTYGPCQMPTLWFCVHRHCEIQEFVPQSFWNLSADLRTDGSHLEPLAFSAEAESGPIWKHEEAQQLLSRTYSVHRVHLGPPVSRKVVWKRPQPLNTVAMLRKASQHIGLSPGDAMHYAEQLYLKGILSYPRTETNRYPANFDLDSIVQMLSSTSTPWAELAAQVMASKVEPRQDGTDFGDHPPITPVKLATAQQCQDEWAWELYKLVSSHFLATLSPDCIVAEAKARLEIGDVVFEAKSVRRANQEFTWCDLTGDSVEETPVDLTSFPSGLSCDVLQVKLEKQSTKPPPYLSESDLLELMERHGIGTDASMAQHISNVLRRGYVWLDEASRELRPEPLGLALSHAYTLVDPGLVRPSVRAAIENECSLIAQGRAMKRDVVSRVVNIFESKFRHFTKHVDRVPSMLAVAYALEQGQTCLGEAFADWTNATRITAAVRLQDILQSRNSILLEHCTPHTPESEMVPCGYESHEERGRAMILRVQTQLDALGFQASREAEEGDVEPEAKRRRVFSFDSNKTALQNLNEFCQREGIKSKIVLPVQDGAQFRCKISIVLADGQQCEFASAQAHAKKKAAEHDAASVALCDLLAKRD